MDSTTLPVTFALDGSAAKLENILKWETAMKDYLLEQMGRRPDLKIAFSTDRALEVISDITDLNFVGFLEQPNMRS